MNDSELLHAWAVHRDEAAFAELVRRHLNLVHASARRQVGASSPLADDIAQAVFLVLASKAGSLGSDVVLSGWLFRTTRFVTTRVLRAEQRRIHRETTATMQPADAAAIPEHWKEVEPHLDGALASLSAADRDALLLRYFEGKPLRAVGEQLGLNEDAARKRVVRAVDRLREWLSGRGVALTAAGLATVLANLPVGAAPLGLAAQIAGAAIKNTAGAVSVSAAAGAIRDWWFVQVRRVFPWAAAALLLCVVGTVLLLQQTAPDPAVAQAETASWQNSAPDVVPTEVPPVAISAPSQIGPSKILLSIRSAGENRPLVARVAAGVWSKQARLGGLDSQTDTNGVIEIPVADPDVSSVYVSVSALGFVPEMMEWKRHEFVEPVLFYQCLLDRGEVLEGLVQDESGNPVADARIVFFGPGIQTAERESIQFSERLSPVSSDINGRFRCDQLPRLRGDNAEMEYFVMHPDFIKGRGMLYGAKSLTTNHVVVLKRGEWINGRVEDSSHMPVPDTIIEESGVFVGRKTTNGPDGRFRLGPYSRETVELEASANGFKKTARDVLAGADTNEVLILLSRADGSEPVRQPETEAAQVVRIAGKVVDDESGEPLSRFRIRLRQSFSTQFDQLVGDGNSGRFDWPYEMTFREYRIPAGAGAELHATISAQLRQYPFSIKAESEGYEEAVSEVRQVGDGVHEFSFRLRREASIRGRVTDSSGQSVTGATVGLTGLGFGFSVRTNGTLFGSNAPQTTTDAGGLFSLRLKPDSEGVVVAHASGFAGVSLKQAKRGIITLQPWGAVDGVVMTAGRPSPGQWVMLQSWWSDSATHLIRLDTATVTDDQGRFHFDHVPPGPVAISRFYNFSSSAHFGPRQRVEVPAGGTAEVSIVSTGRAVIGRFALSRTVPGYDWRLDVQKLEEGAVPRSTVRFGEQGTPEYFKRVRSDILARAKIRGFYPEIGPDGSFRIEDVPAGDYTFSIRISAPPVGDDPTQHIPEARPELGSLKIPVTVPAGDFNDPAIDLGTITIPVKNP